MHTRALVLSVCALVTGAVAGPTAAQDSSVDPPHPAHIHAGGCPTAGDVVFPLTDLALAEGEPVGMASAVPVEVSDTTVDLALDEILAADHSIDAHRSSDDIESSIACGDIGGERLDGSFVVIGLTEQNGSGHSGIAWLRDNLDGTTKVQVFLTQTSSADDGDGDDDDDGDDPADDPDDTDDPAGDDDDDDGDADGDD